jgi:hypothetical protein
LEATNDRCTIAEDSGMKSDPESLKPMLCLS